jgi:hypothetical protein
MSVFIKGKNGGVKGATIKVAREKPAIPQEFTYKPANLFIKTVWRLLLKIWYLNYL